MKPATFSGTVLALVAITACTTPANLPSSSSETTPQPQNGKILKIGATPELDDKADSSRYNKLAQYLGKELKIKSSFTSKKDEEAVLSAFQAGELDMMWVSGLLGSQARQQVTGANAIAQRDTDPQSSSVFIANKKSGVQPVTSVEGLKALKGKTFTFSGEVSTPGRIMPQYFLKRAGVQPKDFKGGAGFSKSDQATVELVKTGTYDTGVLDERVWEKHLQEGRVDPNQVLMIWRTPAYPNYHWVIHPNVKQRFGNDFPQKVQAALLKLDPKKADQREILNLFATEKFIPTKPENYADIEQIGRDINKLTKK
jgi:phosphonate transport system substrate-binding protein